MEIDGRFLKLVKWLALIDTINYKTLRVIMYLLPSLIKNESVTINQIAIAENLNMARSDVSRAIGQLTDVAIIKREPSKFSRTISLNIDLDNIDKMIESALIWNDKES